MDKRIRSLACGLLAASALVAPQAALARPASSVEARLDRLEAELTALRGDLAQSRSEAAAATRRAEGLSGFPCVGGRLNITPPWL